MHKILAVVLLLLMVLALPTRMEAAVPDGTRISNDTLRPMAKWVENATHIKISTLPIVVASGIRLKTSLGLQGIQQARSIAAYLPGQIIINNIIWDPDSLRSQSYIVHEMVHHAQLLGGKSYPCNNAKEREAYLLQNRWLEEHGEDAIVSASWIDEMSTCSRR
ncbi:MAG: hypothetical protein HY053_04060 [Proteobacteria bacterium]|nr:hypothetical protein [Pseudomonadota bacterium]